MTNSAPTSPSAERSPNDAPLAPEFIKLAEAIGRGLAREHYTAEQPAEPWESYYARQILAHFSDAAV